MSSNHIQIQSVLFNNGIEDMLRAVKAIDMATQVLQEVRDVSVSVYYGDCSPGGVPCLSEEDIKLLRDAFAHGSLDYVFFNQNLGSAAGHNRLALKLASGYVLIQNPDVIGEPTYLIALLEEYDEASCGMAEARQLPIEHPKEYSVDTGETSWATTACALIPVFLFNELGGFDSDSFFLYCDDVDFSWRVRLAGYKVIYQPAAIVFHDKRLKHDGSWNPSSAERYYSVEAALMMAHKWSRMERVGELLKFCDHMNGDVFAKAANEYRKRLKENRLPKPIDPSHTVSEFIRDDYAKHRFIL